MADPLERLRAWLRLPCRTGALDAGPCSECGATPDGGCEWDGWAQWSDGRESLADDVIAEAVSAAEDDRRELLAARAVVEACRQARRWGVATSGIEDALAAYDEATGGSDG